MNELTKLSIYSEEKEQDFFVQWLPSIEWHKARAVRKFVDKQRIRKKEDIAKKLLAFKDSVEIEGLNNRKFVKGDYEYIL